MWCIPIDPETPPGDTSHPTYSMDWLKSALSEEIINNERDARERIEEAMHERHC
jgi:hypothetical protein